MTEPNPLSLEELKARAKYMVGNPSAWDEYDEAASEVIWGLLAALEEAEGRGDQWKAAHAELKRVADSEATAYEAQIASLTARAEKAEQREAGLVERNATLKVAMQEAIDLLLERIHHNPARSAAHNARLTLQAALSPVTQEGTDDR